MAETEINEWRQQFRLLDDRSQIFIEWLQLVKQHDIKGKQVHDARLVAVMQTYELTHLLTFNGTDFQRYPMITSVHPEQIAA